MRRIVVIAIAVILVSSHVAYATDTTPPVCSYLQPQGVFPSGTDRATLFLFTDEPASCRYDTVPGVSYSQMPGVFTSSDDPARGEDTWHEALITGLSDGNAYSYYVRCQDHAGNATTWDETITFSISTEPGTPWTIWPPLTPAPESLPLVSACAALGYGMGQPDADIEAGQATIPLPPRGNHVDISTPMVLDQPDTQYNLMNDVTSPLTAFTIAASDVTLNLNGYTLTYGTADSSDGQSYGVLEQRWSGAGIVIANGNIVQGNGACSGDGAGRGCNPIRGTKGTAEIGGLQITWHTPDTHGIFIQGTGAPEVHHNTLVDTGTVVTSPPMGIFGLALETSDGAHAHHNKILPTRHRGISPGDNMLINNNEIHINSYAVNSYGILVWGTQNLTMHSNKIYGYGDHPMGVGPFGAGASNIRFFSNYVEMENTRSVPGGTDLGGGFGFRITDSPSFDSGGAIEAMCNYILVRGGNSHPDLVPAETLDGKGKSWGRGLWLGGLEPGKTADIHHNYVEALQSDPDLYTPAVAVVSVGDNSGLSVEDNLVVANQTMVSLGDPYGGVGSGYPGFYRNTFIRKDSYPTYKTIADTYWEYWDVTGRFIDNTFLGGADLMDENVQLLVGPCPPQTTDILVGHTEEGTEVIDIRFTDDPAATGTPFGDCGTKEGGLGCYWADLDCSGNIDTSELSAAVLDWQAGSRSIFQLSEVIVQWQN